MAEAAGVADDLKDLSVVSGLQWTGKLVHLTELGYSLWLSGSVNGGKATLQEIMDTLGQIFGVTVERPSDHLRDMRKRKRLTRTQFLDNLRLLFNDYMDDLEELPGGIRRPAVRRADDEEDNFYLS